MWLHMYCYCSLQAVPKVNGTSQSPGNHAENRLRFWGPRPDCSSARHVVAGWKAEACIFESCYISYLLCVCEYLYCIFAGFGDEVQRF